MFHIKVGTKDAGNPIPSNHNEIFFRKWRVWGRNYKILTCNAESVRRTSKQELAKKNKEREEKGSLED